MGSPGFTIPLLSEVFYSEVVFPLKLFISKSERLSAIRSPIDGCAPFVVFGVKTDRCATQIGVGNAFGSVTDVLYRAKMAFSIHCQWLAALCLMSMSFSFRALVWPFLPLPHSHKL
jgi:hypothetical protein